MKNGPYELIVPPPEYPGKRYRGRYAYEHRVNWWAETGLNPDDYQDCVVHHKNEKKRDNIPVNLDLMDGIDHRRHHARPRTMHKHQCLHCGTTFERRAGVKPTFCSRRCIGLYCHRGRAMV